MSEKDTTAKDYMSDNSRFADLFNYIIFGGKQVIAAETLIEKDSTEIISFFNEENTEKSIKLQKWRDLLKMVTIKSNDEAIFAILGIENQSEVHYAMAVRNLLYDAVSYAKQVDDTAKQHRKMKDTDSSAEFLSGFTSDDKLKPVITLTIYWGTEKWDAPRTLHEMLNTDNVDILRYVSDYKLNLVVPQEITDFSGFHTELGKLFNVFKCAKERDVMDALLKNDTYNSVKTETVDMLNTFLGIKIPKNVLNKKGEIDVCKAWEDQLNAGLEQGLEQGIEAFILDKIEDKCSEEVIIAKLIKSFSLTEQKAKEYFEKYGTLSV